MGTSKGGLARDSRGIEHLEAQDAECSGPRAYSPKCFRFNTFFQSHFFSSLSTCQLRWLGRLTPETSNGHKQGRSCQRFPRHWTSRSSRRRMLWPGCKSVWLLVARSVEYEACVSVTLSDMVLSGNSVKLVFLSTGHPYPMRASKIDFWVYLLWLR